MKSGILHLNIEDLPMLYYREDLEDMIESSERIYTGAEVSVYLTHYKEQEVTMDVLLKKSFNTLNHRETKMLEEEYKTKYRLDSSEKPTLEELQDYHNRTTEGHHTKASLLLG